MADVLTKNQRSYNMSRIRSSNTKPEELVGKYLFSKGLRYRKNVKTLPGKPDLVFPKYKTVVQINGCFWHHHDCHLFKWPATNEEFWRKKISSNEERDKRNTELLTQLGWRVLTVWECQLKKNNRDQTLKQLYKEITGKTEESSSDQSKI